MKEGARARLAVGGIAALLLAGGLVHCAGSAPDLTDAPELPRDRQLSQTADEAIARSAGCVTCHTGYVDAARAQFVDDSDMHATPSLHLGCVDCHGGDANATTKEAGHPTPPTELSGAPRWLAPIEWVRFVNPGDLRAAPQSCGSAGCHGSIVTRVRSGMMAHGAMLWGAALYANGAAPWKDVRFGEAYTEAGEPARIVARVAPSEAEQRERGWLPSLEPLPRWEITEPGNVLRVFERGGRKKPEIGIPNILERPGEPEIKLSNRGFATITRTDPVYLGLQKTRLLDPTLNLPGTNDHAGDYRESGCSACHVLYANDRDPVHSGALAQFGNGGLSATADPTIDKTARGHPVKHRFTRSIPTSQCIVCHVHPGTSVTNSFLGTIWWNEETDGERLYPKKSREPTPEVVDAIQRRNPQGAALRGRWSDPEFLASTGTHEFNATLENTRLADFHGHGWLFRNVYQRDRRGNLLDRAGATIADADPAKFEKAVHLMDIHLEKGMHCVDCHFEQDSHGTGHLHGEMRGAIEIGCVDCHGTASERATLRTSGPAAPRAPRDSGDAAGALPGTSLEPLTTPFGERRFFRDGDRILQRSVVEPGKTWEVVQVLDTVTPGASHYNAKSARAKTLKNGAGGLAHADSRMTCAACHTSWTTSCFGCHLPMSANRKKDNRHNEGTRSRNWTSYDFQTLRDDVYMLAIDGTVTGNKISPARSACAVLVSSQNEDREWIYSQQQTISTEGFSGQAFSTYVPHTVRGAGATKGCSDCHVSAANDNNAWMAQLLLLGTNQTNFIGRYAWVATGEEGFEAVVVTERDAPQAVIGSNLHRIAFPEAFAEHVEHGAEDGEPGRQLERSIEHPADDVLDRVHPFGPSATVLSVQLRGEYLYAACGKAGLRVFDVANVDDKGISEKTISAPVSPLGQRLYVTTKDARFVASPSTTAIDPTRERRPENEEQAIHPLYAYLYVADFEEGLVLVNAVTLLDGDPRNNFLERALAFNPDGALAGATSVTIAGEIAYVCCDRGLAVVRLADPLHPELVTTVGAPDVDRPRSVQVQFRYAFVADARGLRVLDVTDPALPRAIPGGDAAVPIDDARSVYVARTHAYVAAGARGLAIVDVERPERPQLEQWFDAGGALDDVHDVKVGMTNDSLFAYVADGKNGLRVIELVTSGVTPGFGGFTQMPEPKLIATFKTHGPALAVSEGIDRDRAVDESGHQLSVFDRRGARPFTLAEMQRLYLRDGKLYTVDDQGNDDE